MTLAVQARRCRTQLPHPLTLPEEAAGCHSLCRIPPVPLEYHRGDARRNQRERGSAPAKALDLVLLDRFAGRGDESHHFVAIADENAGYGDRGASVCRRSAKFSTAALVMYLPVHHRYIRDSSSGSTERGQKAACSSRNPTITSSHKRLPCRASTRTGHPLITSSPPPGSERGSFLCRGNRRSMLAIAS